VLAVLALTLALQQEPAVLDTAVYENAALRLAVPRPFPDWVFLPATERGTTTVIFQPRRAALSDQLWGALVVTSWGRRVPLREVADRRLRSTWRLTLGAGYRLLARDSLAVDGWPAVRLLVSGAIARAALEVEEYLVARDSVLIVLQLRYPRGVPRDSIATGYRRTVAGLRVGRTEVAAPAPPATATLPSVAVQIEFGQLRLDLPAEFTAVAAGQLTVDAASGGQRLMRWRPAMGEPDTTLIAVGRYRRESRREGRLTVQVWHEETPGATARRVTDSTVAQAVGAWRTFRHRFGPVAAAEVSLVETTWPRTRGAAGTVFLGADLTPAILARELSRTWWGGTVTSDARTAPLVSDALPSWSGALATGDTTGLSPAALALQAAARLAGPERFREAIRAYLHDAADSLAVERFARGCGEQAAALIMQLLVNQ
jgi:hypothetical protein